MYRFYTFLPTTAVENICQSNVSWKALVGDTVPCSIHTFQQTLENQKATHQVVGCCYNESISRKITTLPKGL